MIATHEKIETVVNSWLRGGHLIGTMGELTPLRGGLMRVECDGKTVIICRVEGLWCVEFKGKSSVDASLIGAARSALLEGEKVNITTNYKVDTTC